eukprot:CAMPEP_0172168366 /NCGR_PEP_ID=MMETSP1050-20130122/10098_1 /TAXON_ID=233186 /ORGANISM="Cryptomonas curvata, Strain CCAP979/52" /LENGTH=85 /DNA_ID=CAMNT_0012839281 /DNA_START=477 /DNA_END=734 /DNA_ORIENTATION=-
MYDAACIDGSSTGPVSAGVEAGTIATDVVVRRGMNSMRLGLGVVVKVGIRAFVMMGTGVRDFVIVTWTVTRNVAFFGAGYTGPYS